MPSRRVIVGAILASGVSFALALNSAPSRAEEPQGQREKYGADWNCGRLSAAMPNITALEKICQACLGKGEDFVIAGDGGYCKNLADNEKDKKDKGDAAAPKPRPARPLPVQNAVGVGNCEMLDEGVGLTKITKKTCYRFDGTCTSASPGPRGGSPERESSQDLELWPAPSAKCDGEPMRRFAENCRAARLSRIDPPNCPPNADLAKPPYAPETAKVPARCPQQLEIFVGEALRDERAAARATFKLRLVDDKECKPYLEDRARAEGATVPEPDGDLKSFACKLAPEECGEIDRQKRETAECEKLIDEYVRLSRQRKKEPDQFHQVFDASMKPVSDAINKSARCREICRANADCVGALAALPVPGPRPLFASNAAGCGAGISDLWRYGSATKCVAQYLSALQQPSTRAPGPSAPQPAQSACPPGFAAIRREGLPYCGAHSVSDEVCRRAGGGMIKDMTAAGGGRNLCLVRPTATLANAPSVRTAPPPTTNAPTPPRATSPTTPAPATKTAAPPSTPQPGLSPRCQQLVADYVAAARANDGPRALAGYSALKGAGGCGILQKADRPVPKVKAPPPSDSRFISRGATPNTDEVVGSCDASPAECAARVRQLQAGTSPEAKAALYSHAIGTGLRLGSMLGSGLMMAAPPSVPQTVRPTTAAPGTRTTYGLGSPVTPAPRTRQSDITGTK